MIGPTRALLFLAVLAPALAAQANRPFLEIGAGTLAPSDPFTVTLALRASGGVTLGGRNAVSIEYTRQSAPRGYDSNNLGKYARDFLGIGWQHAFQDVLSDPEPKRMQYLVRIVGGALFRGTFPEAVDDQDLRNAPFAGFGLLLRYPISSRVIAVGSIEDILGFLPAETVRSYCSDLSGQTLCYPQGGPDYYTIALPDKVQHNPGFMLTMQFRL